MQTISEQKNIPESTKIDISDFVLNTEDDDLMSRALTAPDFGRLGERRLMALEDFLVGEVGEDGVFVISVSTRKGERVYLKYQTAGNLFLKPKAFVKDNPKELAPEEVLGMATIAWEDLGSFV